MPWWGWLAAWIVAQLPMGMMVGRVMRHLAREQLTEVHCATAQIARCIGAADDRGNGPDAGGQHPAG